jgi:hypothetical protein
MVRMCHRMPYRHCNACVLYLLRARLSTVQVNKSLPVHVDFVLMKSSGLIFCLDNRNVERVVCCCVCYFMNNICCGTGIK